MKKVMSVLLSVAMLMVPVGFAKEKVQDEVYKANSLEALDQYELLLKAGYDNDADEQNFVDLRGEGPQSVFSGAYMDKNGKMVILIPKDDKETKKLFKNILGKEDIQFKKAKFTQPELRKVQKEISRKMESLNAEGIQVQAVGIDIMSNQAYVEVFNLTAAGEKTLRAFGTEDILRITGVDYTNALESTTVKGGTAVKSKDNNGSSTLSFCANRDMGWYSQPGVVISGHAGDKIGEEFTYNGVSLGTVSVTGWENNSNADVAFIPVSTSTFNLTGQIPGANIAGTRSTYFVGQTVTCSGKNSTYNSGTVSATSVDVYFGDNVTIKDLVAADYTAIGGDSGAPITTFAGRDNEWLVGVHSGGTGPEYFNKISNVMNKLDVTPITN